MREYFLTTDRIGFSNWQRRDNDLARQLWGDPAVSRFICASGVFTEEDIARRLDVEISNLAQFGVQYFPVFALDSGDLIGCCGLRPGDEDGVMEMGCHLRPQYWRKGFAREALTAMIGYSRDVLHVRELIVGHHPDNVASRNLIQRMGFDYTGDKFYPPTGLYHPGYRMMF